MLLLNNDYYAFLSVENEFVICFTINCSGAYIALFYGIIMYLFGLLFVVDENYDIREIIGLNSKSKRITLEVH